MSKRPFERPPRLQVFIVSSGGGIADWNVSSASIAGASSDPYFARTIVKVRPTVVSTKERGAHAAFMQALNRRLAGYSIAQEEQEPTDARQDPAATDVSSVT